jgi:hypothetical protein
MNVPVCNRNLCLALPSGGGSDGFVHRYFVKRRKIIWCEGLYIYMENVRFTTHTHTYIFDVEKSLQGDHFMYPPLLSKLWIVQNYPPHGSINSLASPADMAWPQ